MAAEPRRATEAQLHFGPAAVAELGDATRHPKPPGLHELFGVDLDRKMSCEYTRDWH
jgi:hypothetical protein